MAISDSRQLLQAVDLGHAGGAIPVVDREFAYRESNALCTGGELPPETLLHSAHPRPELLNDLSPSEHERAAWIVNGAPVQDSPNAIEASGHQLTHPGVGSINTPTNQYVGAVAYAPELLEIAGITLSVRI